MEALKTVFTSAEEDLIMLVVKVAGEARHSPAGTEGGHMSASCSLPDDMTPMM